jgi:hypothetical protein
MLNEVFHDFPEHIRAYRYPDVDKWFHYRASASFLDMISKDDSTGTAQDRRGCDWRVIECGHLYTASRQWKRRVGRTGQRAGNASTYVGPRILFVMERIGVTQRLTVIA